VSILYELGLADKIDHYSGDLSGGESKRLSIALELIDDPSILFLDEPTTGLDSSSSTQCIQLLKKLASEGKTIICTIHTPSALLFDMLDHLYALAEGHCIYQGSSKKLVTFLNELELICPETHNPADFLLEIANNDYGDHHNNRLTEKIENGFKCFERPSDDDPFDTSDIPIHPCSEFKHSSHLISSFINQLKQLLLRNYLTTSRDRTLCCMRILIHLIIAIFIGIMYNGIGDNAANLFNIYKFLFFNIFILMFTAFSSLQTSCELNFKQISSQACLTDKSSRSSASFTNNQT
jgi:ABC-type multidrug transport system ATPase subunit